MNLTIGLQYAFSIFVIPFQETYGWSRAEIALGLTISVSILNVSGLFLGYFVDLYGPREMGLIGALLVGLGFGFMYYQNTLIEYYLSYGLLVGLGSGILYMSNISAITRSGFEKVGSALGFIIAGFGLSAGFFGPLLSYVITNYGLKQAFLMLSIVGFTLTLAVLSLPTGNRIAHRGYLESLRTVIYDRYIRALWIIMALATSIGFAVSSFLKPYAKEFFADEILATLPIVSFALGNSLGRFLSGALSDIFETRKILAYTIVYHAINSIALVTLPYIIPYIIFVSTFIAGLGYGSMFTLSPKLTTEAYGSERIGQNYGAVLSSTVLGSFLGSYMSNAVYDVLGTYALAMLSLALIQVFSLALTIKLKNNYLCSFLTDDATK